MFSYSLDDPETKRIKVQPHSKKKLTVSFLIVSSTCRWPRNQSTVSSSFFLAGSRHLMIKLHVYHLVYVGYVVISFFWQQLRKLLLEILHRIPTNEHLRPHFQVHFTTEMLKKDTCTCTIAVMEISTDWSNPWNCMRYFYQPGQYACWFCLVLYACNLCAIQNS